jgi:hypothetical protein
VWANLHPRLKDGVWVDDCAGMNAQRSGNAHARDSNPGSAKFKVKMDKSKTRAKTALEPVGIC